KRAPHVVHVYSNNSVGNNPLDNAPDRGHYTHMEVKMTKEELLFTTKRMHSELVYNMTKLEGNPFTYPEVKTLLDGITVGGRRLTDQEQVLRVSRAWEELRNQVAHNMFTVTKANFIHFNTIVAEGEALSVGDFRNGQVYIAGVEHY
ncbi:filamentation induced by cAMP protein Fic, partial [Pasteurella multocida subsp. multocida str. Anand1_buffalo]